MRAAPLRDRRAVPRSRSRDRFAELVRPLRDRAGMPRLKGGGAEEHTNGR